MTEHARDIAAEALDRLAERRERVESAEYPSTAHRHRATRQQQQLDEVIDRFAYHPATPVTGPLHDETRTLFQGVAAYLLETVPAGRHQSLALTALQEAMMWSNAGIAIDTSR